MNTTNPELSHADPLEPGLYIVATPIGNLGDITLRAVDILQRCDVVACEDTRVTGKLLAHLGISKPMRRYDDHSKDTQRAALIEAARGGSVVLVSDAGTPLVSDPGYRLVSEARAADVNLTSIPGACAAITGLTLAGLPNDRFLFGGFMPVKDKARQNILRELGSIDATLIFYETGPRLEKSLAVIAGEHPDRAVVVARELTKLHEECRAGSATELLQHYAGNPPKGEIVLLIGPPADDLVAGDADELLREALVELSPSKAAGMVARATGLGRKELYDRAVRLKGV